MAVIKGTKSNKGNAGSAEVKAWVGAHGIGGTPKAVGAESIHNAIHDYNTRDTSPYQTGTVVGYFKNMMKKGK